MPLRGPGTIGLLVEARAAFMRRAWRLELRLHGPPYAARRSLIWRAVRAASRWLGRRSIVRRDGFVLSRHGVWLADRPGDSTFRYSIEATWGFGVDLAHLLRRIDAPFLLLDVGANIGLFGLIALENRWCTHVHMFEPDPASTPYLISNLERSLHTNWALHPFALSSSEGEAILWSPEGSSGQSALGAGKPGGSEKLVPVVSTDYLLRLIGAVQNQVFCKIDTEGHEAQVLEGMLPELASSIAAFWIEFSAATDAAACRRRLASCGYSEILRSGSDGHFDALWVRTDDPLALRSVQAQLPSAIASGDRTPRRR